VSLLKKFFHQVRADEPRASGNQNPGHVTVSLVNGRCGFMIL
jgi:hypothetical protein